MSVNSSASVRKLVIKPFKVQPKLPETFFATTWEKLRSALQAVYQKNASSISKEELYRAVEDLCVQKHAAQVYANLSAEIGAVTIQKVNLLKESTAIDACTFLQQVENIWSDHCEQLSTIRNIFLYMDRGYAIAEGQKGIMEMGHGFFRKELEAEAPQLSSVASLSDAPASGLLNRIVASLLQLLQVLRNGDATQRDTIGTVCKMLCTLDLYSTNFEPALIVESKRFFSAEGAKRIAELDVSQFMLLVDRRISETLDWTFHLLDISSRRPLLQIVEQELLAPHVSILLESFAMLVQDMKIADLKRLARLLGLLGQLDLLRVQLLNYIKSVGQSLYQSLDQLSQPSNAPKTTGNTSSSTVKDKETRDSRFIEDVLDFQERMDRVVEEAFKHTSNRVANSSNDQPNGHVNSHSAVNGSSSSSDVLRSALRVGFDFIVNIQPRYVAEQLARYVDRKLRGEQGVSEAEAELCLSRAMLVFKFLAEKDIFEAFYKKLLAKRLLLEKSASNDLERSMLSKLKTECGAQFTSKLEGMFSDLDLSAQCLAQFRTFAASSQGTNYVASSCAVETSSKLESLDADSFHLWLLTQGHWPNTTSGTNVSNNTSSSSSSSSNTNVGEDFPLSLPRELLPLKQQFQTFYESHFQGRRLLWGYSLSRAVVLVTFYSLNSNINSNSSNSSSTPKQRVYEVDVTLSQALVLRCFSTLDNYRTSSRNLPNTNGSWTAAQVSQQTGVPLEDATLCLLSFTAPLSKPSSVANASLTKLLIKQTHPAQAAQQELSFAVNMNFESRMRRMKVLLPTSVRDASTGQSVTSSSSTTTSAELETAQTLEEVFRERAYQCDAAIVRIMKARKRLLHAQLMAEVMQQLRFPSQNADIKKRIEALIERDYLERDPDDVNYYKYVA